VHLIHRESWQSELAIYESKAEVTSFCLELSKKLNMRYENPSLPVDLTITNKNHQGVNLDASSVIQNMKDDTGNKDDSNDDDSSLKPSALSNFKESIAYIELMTMYDNTANNNNHFHKKAN
jgi:hypothetical protein